MENDQQYEQDALRKRRCIPCTGRPLTQHDGCWGLQEVPRHLIHLFWCECPCSTGEVEARAVLGKEHALRVLEQPHE